MLFLSPFGNNMCSSNWRLQTVYQHVVTMMLVALPRSDHPQTLLCRTSLHSCCKIHKNKHHEKAVKSGLSLETWLYHLLSDTENRQYEAEDVQLTVPLYVATEHSSPAHLIMVIHECPYSSLQQFLCQVVMKDIEKYWKRKHHTYC